MYNIIILLWSERFGIIKKKKTGHADNIRGEQNIILDTRTETRRVDKNAQPPHRIIKRR